ncbi:GNAT family N-acetyltransferase [Chitinophaga pendula]|uniref:GNAT family N-acetyltransferase n=1 Tax=Chitinophaga TaxID=79328 RepID=UPI000BAF0A7E|nr:MULTISPECIES: GNAT family N-acetyltransferase [Chitinophaga]ASZ12768.1 GNAT family N-acetyltransferase [Chitinophaga sp. MD30]UCJ09612.1 GNAT family N-acetyltransferase [Chitinophaga pendula]
MLTIQEIFADDHPDGGKHIHFTYTSDYHYKVVLQREAEGWQIRLQAERLAAPFVKAPMEGPLFEAHKTDLRAFVALWDGVEAGLVAYNFQEWNNTIRVWDLYIAPAFKRRGIGSALMQHVKEAARQEGARAVVLESQSSNYPAIRFYLSQGFDLVGLDTISYSNEDVQQGEVRLELGWVVSQASAYDLHGE